jgi:hypothetical protein
MVEGLKPLQFGLASGIVLGIIMFFMGLMGMFTGSNDGYYGMGGMMGYGYGYDYSLGGSLMGLVYGFVVGLIGGGAIAFLYNYIGTVVK